jgi:cell division protein FtsB
MLESRDKVATAQSQLLALASKNTQLDGEISSLQTNDGVEREIRSKFGVAKPDESMVVIVSDSDSTSSATTTPITFWSRFKHFFGF